MKKLMFITVSLFFIFSNIAFSQLRLTISTDKPVYNYGEKITILAKVKNISDSTFTIMMSSFESCQAGFRLNGYDSGLWTSCLPTTENLIFLPNESRIYEWKIDPYIFGLPNKDGLQKLFGKFAGGMFHPISLTDSSEFSTPMFLGGQIEIGYSDSNSAEVAAVRDSLNAQVLNVNHIIVGSTSETWQILGTSVDSIFNWYRNDKRFRYVELDRQILYNQIITEVLPGSIPDKFLLEQNFPNPFNPTTTIKYSIPVVVGTAYAQSLQQNITLKVYNVLGQELETLVNEKQSPGNYQVTFSGDNLPSGVYIYRIEAGTFVQSKKMILLR